MRYLILILFFIFISPSSIAGDWSNYAPCSSNLVEGVIEYDCGVNMDACNALLPTLIYCRVSDSGSFIEIAGTDDGSCPPGTSGIPPNCVQPCSQLNSHAGPSGSTFGDNLPQTEDLGGCELVPYNITPSDDGNGYEYDTRYSGAGDNSDPIGETTGGSTDGGDTGTSTAGTTGGDDGTTGGDTGTTGGDTGSSTGGTDGGTSDGSTGGSSGGTTGTTTGGTSTSGSTDGGDCDSAVEDCGESEVTGGGDCGAPPVCSGDAVQCAQLYQLWEIRCEEENSAGDGTDCDIAFDCSGDPINCEVARINHDFYCSFEQYAGDTPESFYQEEGLTNVEDTQAGDAWLGSTENIDSEVSGMFDGIVNADTNSTSSCPGDISVSFGQLGDFDWSWDLLCGYADALNPLVKLIAVFLSLSGMIRVLRGN